jgi:hypothetical protein
MSKLAMMKRSVSVDAFSALGRAGVTHAGRVVVLADESAMIELRRAGVVGKGDGLTVVGSALAVLASEAAFAAMF